MKSQKAKFEKFQLKLMTGLEENVISYKSTSQNMATRKFFEDLEKKNHSPTCLETIKSWEDFFLFFGFKFLNF